MNERCTCPTKFSTDWNRKSTQNQKILTQWSSFFRSQLDHLGTKTKKKTVKIKPILFPNEGEGGVSWKRKREVREERVIWISQSAARDSCSIFSDATVDEFRNASHFATLAEEPTLSSFLSDIWNFIARDNISPTRLVDLGKVRVLAIWRATGIYFRIGGKVNAKAVLRGSRWSNGNEEDRVGVDRANQFLAF